MSTQARLGNRRLVVRDTQRYGLGVFAKTRFDGGSVIHVCRGRRITLNEFIRLVNTGKTPLNDPLQVGVRTFLLLDRLSRSFNHSCEPNAGIRGRSELFALRPIRSGEEITYDYSTTIAPTIWTMVCSCGSPGCRGTIGDIRSIPPQRLRWYREHGAVQTYMRRIISKPDWRQLPAYERAALRALGVAVPQSEGEPQHGQRAAIYPD
jgi:hypothetical protein